MNQTRPERYAERQRARQALAKAKACGGCFCCLNRHRESEGPTRAACGLTPPQRFPHCDFDPDHSRLYSPENVE